MKMKHFLTVVAMTVASTAAFANDPGPVTTQAQADHANLTAHNNYPVLPFVSTKTRAEVIEELRQARAQGLIANRNQYPILPSTPSNKTRDQVQAEAAQH